MWKPLQNKAGLKQIIGKDECLGKSITPLADFEVIPPITVPAGKLVPLNEFLWKSGILIPMYSGSCIGISR